MKNIIKENKIFPSTISNNPFSLKIKIIEQNDFLSKMKIALKEIILIEENENENNKDNDINSSSFNDRKSLFSYSSEHSFLILIYPNLNYNII